MAAVSWKNPVSGDWSDAADWSTGTVPGDDDVTIGVAGTYTVSLTAPTSVRSITLSAYTATLAITDPGKTVTVSGDLSDSGTLAIDASGSGGSTLKVGGTLFVLANTGILDIGNSAITQATVVTAAALDNNYSIAITGGLARAELYVASAAPATLNGQFQLTGNARLEYASSSIATIGRGGDLSLDGTHAVAVVRGETTSNSALAGLTENDGQLSLADGARLALAGGLTNTGALALDATGSGGGRLIIGGMLIADASQYSGTGVIQIGNGSITESTGVRIGSLDNAGSIYVTGGAAWASLQVSGTTDNTGLIFLTNASATFAGNVTGTGTVWVNGGHLTIDGTLGGSIVLGGTPGPVDAPSLAVVDGFANGGFVGLFGGPAEVRLEVLAAAPAILKGTINLGNDALLEYASGAITSIAANSQLLLTGQNAFVSVAGETHSSSALRNLTRNAGFLTVSDGADVITAVRLANGGGAITVGGGSRLTIGGTLINSGSGSIEIAGGAALVPGLAILRADGLRNYGKIELSGLNGGAMLALGGRAYDAGSIVIEAGVLSLGGHTLNISGLVGGSLILDNGTLAGGALSGSGEIRTDGSADTLNGLTICAGTTIAADSSTLTVYGLVVKGTLGGHGTSTLAFGRPGADNMANIAGFGTIDLADGGENRLTLADTNFPNSGGTITINDGNTGNIIDASALTAGFSIVVHAGQGADVLKGGGGDDVFYAYGGNQPAGDNTTMTGGAGNNQFIFTAPGPAGGTPNNNVITDFAASSGNKIVFSNSGFALGLSGAGSTPQALPADLFIANASGSFANTTQRFAYDTGNGDLYYNAAGSGGASGSNHLIAQLAHDPSLAASQLFFIS